MPTLRAVIEGYQEHLFDLKCLSVYQGFWAGYFGNSKKPKSLNSILMKLVKEHQQQKKRQHSKKSVSKPAVDVDKFLARERRFNQALERSELSGRK